MGSILPASNQPMLPSKPLKELFDQLVVGWRMGRRLFLVSVLFLICLFTVPQSSNASYSLVLLDYPDSYTTTAIGIDDGNIVGCFTDGSGVHGFKYDGTAWTSLNYPGVNTGTVACDISGHDIVGWYTDDAGIHGFKYDGTTWTSLNYPGASSTYASGIDGDIIVGWYWLNDGSGAHGFKFDGTTWTSLNCPDAPSELINAGTWAKGISGGNIVGSYSDGYVTYGFKYDGVTWTKLMPPVTTSANFINGIDGDNIVGWYGTEGFISNGTVWTSLYYPGSSWTQANGISGCHIVGSHSDSHGYPHGFLAAQEFLLSVAKTGLGNGEILPSEAINWSGNVGTAAYPCNTSVILTALAANDSTFTDWEGCDAADGNQCTVTMSNDRMVTAAFSLNPALTIALSGTGLGSIISSPQGINCGSICSAHYDRGAVVTLMPVPNEGSIFSGWSGGGCTGYGTCVTTLNTDTSITAEFTAIQVGKPIISVSPAAVNFGSLKSGSAPTQKEITLRNTGKGSLIIDSIDVAGTNAKDFALTNSCLVIPSNSSCKISVTFASTLPFGKKSAIIKVSSNSLKNPNVKVRLSGKTDPPKIAVSPKSISFDPLQVGYSSLPKMITIKNNGVSDVLINDITITGANEGEFSLSNSCSTIPKDSSCMVSVTFVPDFPASKKKAMLRISSNDPKKAIINVKLSGKGT